MSFSKLIQQLKGGPGSGNFGHSGRKGKRGGSAPKGGGGVLAFEVMDPRSFREHTGGSYMRESYAKELSKALGGKSSPDSAGSHQTDYKSAQFSTKKSQSEVQSTLMDKGFVKSGADYYKLGNDTGVKASLTITPHKPGFYSEPEDWTTVTFTSVIKK